MKIKWHYGLTGPCNEQELIKYADYVKSLRIEEHLNVFFYANGDLELIVPEWIICQTSVLSEKSFAVPYYFKSFPNNKNFFKKIEIEKEEEKYDLSFCGAFYPNRFSIINFIRNEFKDKKLLIIKRKRYYYSIEPEKRTVLSLDGLYKKSIYQSRLCLAPAGCGPQSARFFEIMSSGNIPVFIGDKNTKFPLDWIINWKDLVPIIYLEDLESKKGKNIINEWLEKCDKELNWHRVKIKEIYDKYLSVNKKDILKTEIENRIYNIYKI